MKCGNLKDFKLDRLGMVASSWRKIKKINTRLRSPYSDIYIVYTISYCLCVFMLYSQLVLGYLKA